MKKNKRRYISIILALVFILSAVFAKDMQINTASFAKEISSSSGEENNQGTVENEDIVNEDTGKGTEDELSEADTIIEEDIKDEDVNSENEKLSSEETEKLTNKKETKENTENKTTRDFTESGLGTSEDPYEINGVEDLEQLRDEVNAGEKFSGVYFKLMTDLDMSSIASWAPIGNSDVELQYDHRPGNKDIGGTDNGYYDPLVSVKSNIFEGVFDGNNKSISNLRVNKSTGYGATTDYNGLFGFVHEATIKDLTLDNASIYGQSGSGVLVGYARGTVNISNVTVNNPYVKAKVETGNYGIGGLVGVHNYYAGDVVRYNNIEINNAEIISGDAYGRSGGMIGIACSYYSEVDTSNSDNLGHTKADGSIKGADVEIVNCNVLGGSIAKTSDGYAHTYMGGLIGMIMTAGSNDNTTLIKGCYTDIAIEGSNAVGGLLGQLWDARASYDNETRVIDCHSKSLVDGTASTLGYVGGLIGYMENYYLSSSSHRGGKPQYNYQLVDGCSATGNVSSGYYYNGGLIGHLHNGATVKNSWATGNVTGKSYGNGGLVGAVFSGGGSSGGFQCHIINSYAMGNIRGSDYNGGLTGYDMDTNYDNCYATGSVTGTSSYNGALIGYQWNRIYYNKVTVNNCYGTGTIVGGTGGGFVGNRTTEHGDLIEYTNCFYDTTTTTKSKSNAIGANKTHNGVTGLTTGYDIDKPNLGMINMETFENWNVKNNINGRANGVGTEDDPWYIDDKVTYPYLWFQYDGRSDEVNLTYSKADVNYNLSTAKYSFSDGTVTGKMIAPRRADFLIGDADANEAAYYNVKTVGAYGVYFPYVVDDTSERLAFKGEKEIRVPRGGTHTIKNSTTPYSMGGISVSNIISFDPLPYAEKINDTSDYVSGDETTYTKRGDTVEYKVTITNPSIRYKWLGVEFKDPFPEGVTLLEGLYNSKNYDVSLRVNGGDKVIIPEDTANGSNPYYYTYTKAEDPTRDDSPLYIYLGDFPTATLNDDGSVTMYEVELTFTTIIDRRAVSQFPLTTAENILANGDNIENTGTVNGTILDIYDSTNTFPYETDYDDYDDDPVFDSYKVSYIGNGGKTSFGDRNYDEYFLFNKSSTVDDNKDDPFEFTRLHYSYLGQWYSKPAMEENTTYIYEIGDTISLVNNKNPIQSGFRTEVDEIQNEYTDYYPDIDFKLYAPWQLQTGSIRINKTNGSGQPIGGARFLLETYDEDNNQWKAIRLNPTNNEWIDLPADEKYSGETLDTGVLFFGKNNETDTDNTLPFGKYRITEVKAASGYALLKEPIELELPYEKISDTDPNDGWSSKYTNKDGDTVYSYNNLTYNITNVGSFDLPKTGNEGRPWFVYFGGILAIFTLGFIIYFNRKRKKKIFKETK
ncbi:MAG: LPXTG cell wall anchor domain-containing protein [Lachnospiraceae bacterium]|jgi:LPXTG-motif cell wall-anchored protein/uncharacterized repeat protein (TIGR01451 family)|nr:LPXTG cell wall anchor domain-containing protein [Lachnospiraceae bacterium]